MKGLKVDEIREKPLAEVSARQLSAHIPWLGQDPTQLCQTIVDEIFLHPADLVSRQPLPFSVNAALA